MPLRQTLLDDLRAAMRARDEVRLRTIRSLQAALQQAEIARRQGGAATLDAAEETAVVQKQAKQRRESIAQFEAAGRADLAAKEAEELAVIDAYLPQMLDDEAIRAVVARVVAETGAEGPQAMGRVRGPVMVELRGRADGRRVQELVKEALG
jgi:uncharacterized protein